MKGYSAVEGQRRQSLDFNELPAEARGDILSHEFTLKCGSKKKHTSSYMQNAPTKSEDPERMAEELCGIY